MLLTINDNAAYYYTGGKIFNPELPTVVFIHGAQNDHSVWAQQSRYFAHHGFNVLAVDLPGHGRSKGAALTSVEALATWLLALLDATGVQTAMLVGHSMGSLIALEACGQAPARVSKLALLACAYPMRVSDSLLTAARDNEQSAIDMVNIWSHSPIASKSSCSGSGVSILGGSRRLMQRISKINPDEVLYTDFSACNNYANGEQAALAVNCPTLFLLARNDMMTPVKASAGLSKAIVQSKISVIDNCGHSMMSEQADAVLNQLLTFAKD